MLIGFVETTPISSTYWPVVAELVDGNVLIRDRGKPLGKRKEYKTIEEALNVLKKTKIKKVSFHIQGYEKITEKRLFLKDIKDFDSELKKLQDLSPKTISIPRKKIDELLQKIEEAKSEVELGGSEDSDGVLSLGDPRQILKDIEKILLNFKEKS